jgi:hypothetical protein
MSLYNMTYYKLLTLTELHVTKFRRSDIIVPQRCCNGVIYSINRLHGTCYIDILESQTMLPIGTVALVGINSARTIMMLNKRSTILAPKCSMVYVPQSQS